MGPNVQHFVDVITQCCPTVDSVFSSFPLPLFQSGRRATRATTTAPIPNHVACLSTWQPCKGREWQIDGTVHGATGITTEAGRGGETKETCRRFHRIKRSERRETERGSAGGGRRLNKKRRYFCHLSAGLCIEST